MGNRLKSNKKNDPDQLKSEKEEKVTVKQLVKDERTHKIAGTVSLLVSLFLFIAFVSYLFTWKEDQDKLVAQLNGLANFSYFIPHARPINASHCSTIITFIGSHACQRMEKKRYWWEYLENPFQSYKCYSEFVPMDVFLTRFVNENRRVRIYEPANGYNDEDPGMDIVAPLINGAIGG